MVVKLKDINKKKIVIKRGEQRNIGVNLEIKNKLKEASIKGETQAETINRVIKTNQQMTELLVTMVESLEETPSKMTELLSSIPINIRNLFEAILHERKKRKKDENKR